MYASIFTEYIIIVWIDFDNGLKNNVRRTMVLHTTIKVYSHSVYTKSVWVGTRQPNKKII